MVKAILVTTDNEISFAEGDWDFRSIGYFVRGNSPIGNVTIEAIRFTKQYFAWGNENAKIFDQPENQIATSLWYQSGQVILLGDYIAGDVLFMGEIDEIGDSTDAPESLYAELVKIKAGLTACGKI